MEHKDLERIRKALIDRKIDKVAEATGLHKNTIFSIMNGTNTNPTLLTLTKLNAYLFGK
jgi:hypothetical protein